MKMKKKMSKRKRLAEGIYDQNGRIVIAYRKNGKLIWNSPGLSVSRPNIQRAIERRAELKYSDKERVIKVDIPLNAYAEIYLRRKRREVAKTTYSKYSFRVKHITDYFGDMQVRKITPQRVEEFYDQLFTEHQLIPDTVREIRRQFNQIMDMAVEDMIVSVNPIKKTKIDKTLADQYSVKKDIGKTFFSCEETAEFLKCCENHELHDFFLYYVFLCSAKGRSIRNKD